MLGLRCSDPEKKRPNFCGACAVSLLLVAFATAQRLPQQNLTNARDHATLGLSLARQGRLAEAEQELRQAVDVAPGVAIHRAQLASILGLEGKWNDALTSFQKALELDPTNLDFRRQTAAVEYELGLLPAAEKNLQYVLEKHPGDSGAILLEGLVSEKKEDYASAARLLDSQFDLVVAHPDRAVALFHSSYQSGQRDKISKLVDALRVRANDPAWTSAIDRCIQIAGSAGDLSTSQTLLALIPGSDPRRPAAALNFAKLLYGQGQVFQAKELLLQLAEHGTGSADLEALLGNCYESEHQPRLAVEAYQRAIEIEPLRIDYYQDLISLLLDLGKSDDAMALVNHALMVAPQDARPWVWKGNVGLRTNAYQDALESYTRASRIDSSNADAVLGIGAVHFVAGESQAAMAEYKAGIARFPKDARFYVACAKMLLASPDSPRLQSEAASLLQKAVTLAPQSAQAHYHLGQLALQQGRLKEAEAELSLSLRSDPQKSNAHFALSAVYRRMGRSEDAAKEFALYQQLRGAEEGGMEAAAAADRP